MQTLRNNVQLIGRLGNDVELRTINNGNALAKLSIATNDFYYAEDGTKVENTYWHNCIAWGKLAERMEQYCKKGKQVALQGKLTNRSFENKEGKKQYITEIQVNEFVLLD